MSREIYLHLGCGPNIMPGWRNYDLAPGHGGISRDLTRPLPEQSESVSLIYTEHFLEHLTADQGKTLLKECFRVLKPLGVLRVSVPCLKHLVNCYLTQDLIDLPGVWQPKTPAAMLNEGMRLWGHQYMYDSVELFLAMSRAGFRQIERRAYRDSKIARLRNLECRPFNQEIIFEATK